MYIICTVFIIFRLYIHYILIIYTLYLHDLRIKSDISSLFQTLKMTDGVVGLYQTLGIARSASKRPWTLVFFYF